MYQGIGQATAVSFIREGCRKIAIADRNKDGLEETTKVIHAVDGKGDTHVLQIVTDVLQEDQIAALIENTVKEFGRIDYAVNAAGS